MNKQLGNVPYYYSYGNWIMECEYKGNYFKGTNSEVQFSLSEEELISKGATKVYYHNNQTWWGWLNKEGRYFVERYYDTGRVKEQELEENTVKIYEPFKASCMEDALTKIIKNGNDTK